MNSDPNNVDTDNEDNSPREKGILSDNGEVVIGELSIVSTDRGAFGHSFLLYKSYVEDVLDFNGLTGGFEYYRSSNGIWQYQENELNDGDVSGIYYNIEFAEEIYMYNLCGSKGVIKDDDIIPRAS